MYIQAVVDLAIEQPLDYAIEPGGGTPQVGGLCIAPLRRTQRVAICVGQSDATAISEDRLRSVTRTITEVEPLSNGWLELTRFAADYYQHGWGEVAIPALPPFLRSPPGPRFASVVAALRGRPVEVGETTAPERVRLNAEQRTAAAAILEQPGFSASLLFGITGSGKTAVYLEAMESVLAQASDSQCLLLVPEINLTPQLLAHVRARFPGVPVVAMHSAMSDRERSAAWLAGHESRARIVVGTRLAVFASLPRLRLIVVDEEHDPSYKAGDGARFSARDLAVKRAQIESIPVVLGSATPSLESWTRAQSGRYRLLRLTERVEARVRPEVQLIDIGRPARKGGLSDAAERGLNEAVARGEQALVFINRRGYAPVLSCAACGWLSNCRHCASYAAFHKTDSTLRCHHCGWTTIVPCRCPKCGNQDLAAVGQGTQRIEEALRRLMPTARVARIDRDTTRRRGAAESAFAAVHSGAVDVLVGTQMIAKGHDFQRVALVVVLNADAQVLSHDFRAPERLFATLMQVAGRAGRAGMSSRVLVQTRFPGHPLLLAFARQDYESFAAALLAERRAAGMPPFAALALLTAEAPELDRALRFLTHVRSGARVERECVRMYDPVPMPMPKVGGVYRAQLLVEADQRRVLQSFLASWLREVRAAAAEFRPRVRWSIEVDPLEI